MRAGDASNMRMTGWITIFRARVPKPVVAAYFIVSIICYIVIISHRPMSIYPNAGGDDGLFITLGRYLVDGNWLGPFDQHTLMKGPGYPAFLALVQVSGLPISIAHALFHCFSITFFVIIAHRFIKSHLLSALLFGVLLWHPVSLSVYLTRVIREQIYCGQVLIVLATFFAMAFCRSDKFRRPAFAIFSGLMLGWYWLTREEGVWILPALAIIVAAAAWKFFHAGDRWSYIVPLTVLICTFAVVQGGYRAANLWKYGKFIGVDVKEPNFERALQAINSVRSGGNMPFVSATKVARQQIYVVSPTFASLKEFIEGPSVSEVTEITCKYYPISCGEIAGGWFMWALRDAAGTNGHFSSPATASQFFKNIADEITTACTTGQLVCSKQLIPEMPQISWKDLAERLPSRYMAALSLLIMVQPPLQLNESMGKEIELAAALKFLNRPLYARSPDLAGANLVLSGWYYKSGRDWKSLVVESANGTLVQQKIVRNPSPDIQKAMKDPEASEQRFTLETVCDDNCVLKIDIGDGHVLEKKIREIRGGATHMKLNGYILHIDSIAMDDPFAPTKTERACDRVRTFLMSHYSWVSIPLLVAGGLSFLLATVLYWRVVMLNACYIAALVSWLLVFLRASLVVLIDSTSFPAVNGLYLSPAHFLLMSGAVLSCAALLNLARPTVEVREAPV